MNRRNSISPQKQIEQSKKATTQTKITNAKAMNQRPPQTTFNRRTTTPTVTPRPATTAGVKRPATSTIADSRQLKRPRTIQTEAEKRKEMMAKAKEKLKELEDSLQAKIQELEKEMQEGKKKYQKDLEDKENEIEDQSNRFKREVQRKQQEVDDLKMEHERQIELEQRSFKRRLDDLKRINTELSDKIQYLERDLSKEKNEKEIALNNVSELQKEHLRSTSDMKRTIDSQNITIEHTSLVSEERRKKIESLEAQFKEALESIEKLKELRIMDEQQRRQLHNQIQELKGNIRVFCRVRPLLPNEMQDDSSMDHISFTDEVDQREIIISKDPTLSAMGKEQQGKSLNFSFDKTFSPEVTQEEVFEEISQLVTSAIDGYKVCIFAYGQTGAGKTFTMEGSSSNFEQRGMIPRSVEKIFSTTEYMKKQGWQYQVRASFLEIYNETLRDLLDSDSKKKLEIKHKDGNTTVTDLTYVDVDGPKKVYDLLKQSIKNRTVASTDCNERSSRSHSVFQLEIIGKDSSSEQETHGMLNLIDLAGSERLAQSHSTGARLEETKHINSSLSTLAKVIQHLEQKSKSEKKGSKNVHVPFRDSKLTYLLQNALGGDAKTLMFCNINPSKEALGESICSLRFASKVNNTHIGTAKKNMNTQLDKTS